METAKKLVNLQDFVAGWIAGIAALVIGHPFDTVKVRQQILQKSFLRAIFFTFRYEGIFGFYKGVLFPSFMIGPSNALFFGVYGNCLHLISDKGQKERILLDDPQWGQKVFFAGVVAGFFQVVLTCPAEVVKTSMQMQTQNKTVWKARYESDANGLIDSFRQIFRMRGPVWFYRGITPMFCRDVPTSGIYTITYETMKNWDYRFKILNNKITKQAIAGGTAGVLSWVIVIPFDVVKSKMQGDNPQNPRYKSMWDCTVKTYREGGWRRFTKGSMAVLLRSFPVNAGIFVSYESSMELLKKYRIFEV